MLRAVGHDLKTPLTRMRLRSELLDDGQARRRLDADLERVFEPFFRLEASRKRSSGGTGLGQGVVRSIARLQGGEVRLRHRKTGGLDAELSFPRRPADQRASNGPGAVPGTR